MSLVLFFALATAAQPYHTDEMGQHKCQQEYKEKIEAQKIAFFTKQLSLTPEQAKAFWPLYDEFQQKKDDEWQRFHDFRKQGKPDLENISDQQANEIADSFIIHSQKMLDINRQYHNRFKEILPVRKVILLYEAEREFKRVILKKIREERHARSGKPRP